MATVHRLSPREAGADRAAAWFTARWGGAAVATVNARLDALGSACAWWRHQNWLTGDPLHRVRRCARTRALARADVETLLSRPNLAVRERILWRLLYDSAARAEEVLALDVDELDLRNGRARLLLPPGGPGPDSGRARLSYRRAAELFEHATTGQPGGPWRLRQLRHSALTHAAEDGANASSLLAYSGHTSVASLARYARVSPARPARLRLPDGEMTIRVQLGAHGKRLSAKVFPHGRT